MPDAKNVSPGSLSSTEAPGNGVRRPRHRVRPLFAWLAVAATVITVATIEAGRLLHGLSHGSVPVLRVYGSPSGLVVSPDGRTLYLADSSANAITPVAAATGKAGRSIPISGGSPGSYWSHDMALTPDGDTLFTSVYDDKAGVNLPLARVDLRTGKEAGQVRAPGGVAAFVMSRDGKTLYVTVEYALETFRVGLPSAQRQLLLSNCGQGIPTCGQATEPGPHCLRCSE